MEYQFFYGNKGMTCEVFQTRSLHTSTYLYSANMHEDNISYYVCEVISLSRLKQAQTQYTLRLLR